MRPYLPNVALLIPEYCWHRHQTETLHKIKFKKYFPKSHRVSFIIICCDCEEECGHEGIKKTLNFKEWVDYINSFVWDNDELTNN